jgi:hypothetical protein
MIKVYDTYGVDCSSLEEARALVESALGVLLQAHESGYRGGDYYRRDDPKTENLVLQRNYYTHQDEWAEPSHKSAPFLLYVSGSKRSDELRNTLLSCSSVIFLHRETL